MAHRSIGWRPTAPCTVPRTRPCFPRGGTPSRRRACAPRTDACLRSQKGHGSANVTSCLRTQSGSQARVTQTKSPTPLSLTQHGLQGVWRTDPPPRRAVDGPRPRAPLPRLALSDPSHDVLADSKADVGTGRAPPTAPALGPRRRQGSPGRGVERAASEVRRGRATPRPARVVLAVRSQVDTPAALQGRGRGETLIYPLRPHRSASATAAATASAPQLPLLSQVSLPLPP